MRHRGPAQRRQVHPLQRPHQGRHRGRELPVLHHRAERRHRRAARPAPRRSWRRSSSPSVSSRRSSSSSTSPAWSPARRKGEGLGNQFLAHIRETDAIVNVVRCFDDENVVHVAGKVDPVADIEVIQTELCLADLATVEKSLARYGKVAKAGNDKDAKRLVDVLDEVRGGAQRGAAGAQRRRSARRKQAVLKPLCLITAKPAMFVANVAEDGFEHNAYLDKLRAYAERQHAPVVAICGEDRGRARRHGRGRPEDVPRGDGADRAGAGASDPRRLRAARPADLLHRRRRRKCAPGRSTSATPRRRRPA